MAEHSQSFSLGEFWKMETRVRYLEAVNAELLEACELAEKAIRLGIPQAALQLIHETGDYDALVLARIRLEEAIARARGEAE